MGAKCEYINVRYTTPSKFEFLKKNVSKNIEAK